MSLLSVLWAIAFGICPQRPSHSLFFGGQQMPIEARMGGIFAGFVIGAAVSTLSGHARAWRLPDRKLYPWSLVAVLGAPLLLGTLATVIVTAATRRSGQAVHWTDVIPLMLGGLALAALFLTLSSLARYALFGPGPLELPGAP